MSAACLLKLGRRRLFTVTAALNVVEMTCSCGATMRVESREDWVIDEARVGFTLAHKSHRGAEPAEQASTAPEGSPGGGSL